MFESLEKRKIRAEKILKKLELLNPNPRSELFYKTPYQFLVSVVLSAQTTDKMVNRCMLPLYSDEKNEFSPGVVLNMGEAGFLKKIRPIGLAPTKAKNILKLTKILIDQYDGNVPRTKEELQALPGVGPKSSNVVLSELYHQPVIAVDTHVYRVTRRMGLHREKTPEKSEKELMKVINSKHLPAGHHCLVLHGRYICIARKPKCLTCPVEKLCPKYGVDAHE